MKDEDWKLIADMLPDIRREAEAFYALCDRIGLTPESPLCEPFDAMYDLLIKALEQLAETDFISWYVWDNDFGERGLRAGVGEDTRRIESLEDLRRVIDAEICDQSETGWRPLESFDSRMFSLVSQGNMDTAEVFKYKGEIPEWATHWMPIDG